MKPAKNMLPKKFGPKASSQNQPPPPKSDRFGEGGLARTVQLLEQDVEQLTRVGQLYRRQIEEL